ncbi:VWA domain-containing protein [Saccharicrinis sp. FJH2]|uniref:VWA domain-containing protein n=1 Tax=Saccharicrinis sp. FJH65 TaxID=3344659 RepID=UPI0035F2B7F9
MRKYTLVGLFAAIILVFSACDEVVDGDMYGDKAGSESMYLADGMAGGSVSGGSGNGDSTQVDIVAGQITAGEWNDLSNWTFWVNLGQDEDYKGMPEHWEYNISTRISVQVTGSSGNPVINETMQLLDGSDQVLWSTKTDYAGMAEFWPGLSGSDAAVSEMKIKVAGLTFTGLKQYTEGVNEITLNDYNAAIIGSKIDIAFVVDATGSMSDELEYLKVELVDVIDSVKETNPDVVINTGSVFYRDEGDEYVTRQSPFTTDITTTVNFIKDQSADGGGDFPEAVHTALNEAINNLQWSNSSKSRLLFLMLDAPPHHETDIISKMNELVEDAAAKGIKIIPVTASGIDKETEFLMRYIAIATNGTYVFITNHSGIGNEHLEPTVGDYEVEYLNHLMVRLINQYLE